MYCTSWSKYYICAIYIKAMKSMHLQNLSKVVATLLLMTLSVLSIAQMTLLDNRRVENNKLIIEISAVGSLDILAMQGSFRFDGRSLSFDRVEVLAFPTLRVEDFSLEGISSVNMVWIDPEFIGQVLPSNTPLFALHFTILNSLDTDVVFANCPLSIEVVGTSGQVIPAAGSIISNRFCTVITGKVYQDLDRNCRNTAADRPLSNVKIEVNGPGGRRLIATNSQGEYTVEGIIGDYELTVIPPHPFWDPCQDTETIRITNINNPRTFDFLLLPGIDCPTVEVRAGVGQLRPCNIEEIYIHYRNAGTVVAVASDLEVRLDSRLTILDVSLPHTIMPPGILFITTGNLQPGQSGIAKVSVEVPCDLELTGSSMCINVIGRPGSTCLNPGIGWTGANIRLNASCAGNQVVLTATNIGNGAMGSGIPAFIFQNDVMIAEEMLTLTPSAEFKWERPADGNTYTILTDQVPGFPVQGPISASVEGCNTTMGVNTGFINQFPKQRDAFASHRICVPVGNQATGSSASKWSHVTGYGESNDLKKGAKLEYVITSSGPGTSINQMLIIDTLQSHVDPYSFRITASSHPVRVSWGGDRIVYMLVDLAAAPVSANDFLFVQFEVDMLANLSLPLATYNMASVYRTIDEPVKTSKVQHRIVDLYTDFNTTSSIEQATIGEQNTLDLYPNPTSDALWIRSSSAYNWGIGEVFHYRIIANTGAVVASGKLSSISESIKISHLPIGNYYLQVIHEKDGGTHVGKFLKR